MSEILKVVIKKAYAASLLAHLSKEEAIEIIDNKEDVIPEWQKEAVRKALSDIEQNPASLKSWDEIKKKYQQNK